MNPIWLILIGAIFTIFYAAHSMVVLTKNYIYEKKPKKAIYIFGSGTIYFSIGLLSIASLAVSAFWFGAISIIYESIFSLNFKYPRCITERELIPYLATLYFFCYSFISYGTAITLLLSNKNSN